MAAELQESYNTGDDGYVSIDQGHWESQTFTAGSDYDISSVKLLLYRTVTYSPGTVYVTIRATAPSGAGRAPTGSDLASGTTDGSTLTTSTAGEWREITFGSPLSLTNGVEYAIVVVCDNAANFALKWRGKSTGAYANGNRASSSDGSSWTESTRDNMFETWGDAPVTYSELSGTITAVSVVEDATLDTIAFSSLSGTIAATSVVGNASLGQVAVSLAESVVYTRLVAVGNGRFYYEAI